MKCENPQPLPRKGKEALVSLLLGRPDLEIIEGLDPMQMEPFILQTGMEAHLLWRLSQLAKSADYENTVLGKLKVILQRRCMQNAARNLPMDATFRQVYNKMYEAGIAVMLLKGTALRARYDELAGRPQCDTDIMVRFEDLSKAERILEEAGYVLNEEEFTREQSLTEHFNLCMIKGHDVVELHWAMALDCNDEAVVKTWQRAEQIDWYGVPVWVPSLPDQVVFTQVHICRHCFHRSLKMYGDMLFELERWPDLNSQLATVRADWPPRMVYGPIKVVADIGFTPDIEAAEYLKKSHYLGSRLDFYLLGTMARAILLEENWLGLPMSRFYKAIFAWLIGKSDRLTLALVQALGRQISGLLKKNR